MSIGWALSPLYCKGCVDGRHSSIELGPAAPHQTVGAAACSPEFYPRHAEFLTMDPLLDLFFAEVTGWARPPLRVPAQVLAVMAWAVEPGGGAS